MSVMSSIMTPWESWRRLVLAVMCVVSVVGRYSDSRVKEVQALEGAVGLLQCPVFTYGSGDRVTWNKQGVDVSKIDSRLSVNQRSGALRIHRAQFLDSGRYTCIVRHQNFTTSRDTLLHVVSYPKITLTQNATVTRNTSASLLCKVESVPVSHITWKRHRIPAAHLSKVEVKEGSISGASPETSQKEGTPSVTVGQLHFLSVQPHHAGLYECLAANTPGTARATLSLRVMYAPIAEVNEKEMVGWKGHIPDLHFQFKADPAPRVTCSHQPMGSQQRYSDLNDVNDTESNVIDENYVTTEEGRHWTILEETVVEMTYITIQLLPEVDSVFGAYTCRAENSAGETTATIRLTNGRIPQMPTVAVDSQRPTWLVLKLRMPEDMGFPPADRIIARYTDVTETENEVVEFDKAVTAKASNSSQNWNITGLTPGHVYNFSIQLANVIATSNVSILQTELPLYAPPDPVQFTSDPKGSYPRNYILSWLPPATHGADLTEYSITYVPVTVSNSGKRPHTIEVMGSEHRVKAEKSAKQIVISGLQQSTFYRVTMVAHSHVGKSQLSAFLFTTANSTNGDNLQPYEPGLPRDSTNAPITPDNIQSRTRHALNDVNSAVCHSARCYVMLCSLLFYAFLVGNKFGQG